MIFDFSKAPPLGTVLMVDAQAFDLVAVEDHARKDGSLGQLLIWAARCGECGRAYQATTTLKSTGVARRCRSHRKPGTRVPGTGRRVTARIYIDGEVQS